MSIGIVDVNDANGNVVAPEWLAAAERVHRQLRPQLPDDYAGKLARVFAGGGRLAVAVLDGIVAGVAVYRIHENTVDGVQMYVDDLVIDESRRSRGVGKALLDHLAAIAEAAGCAKLTLDSGTQRQDAHRFYFRERMTVTAFHFSQALPRTAR
ncbi:MAG TPA: GNAT family N-acetyltransferase [Rhodanobacteraceae bacterium]|nr:GNAT family N-acetyltransferase [Rhodanobacteraceae bacterium]